MALLARVKSKSFLRASCQGLSEYAVGSSGIQFFTRLDSGEQWHVKSFCKSPKSFLKYLDHFFQVMLTPGIEYVMNYLGMMSSFVVGLIWIYYCF